MSVVTQAILPALEKSAAVPTELIWRLSVDQYQAMIHAGILTTDDPVDPVEGWLVSKMSKNPLHRIVTRLIHQALERFVPAGWYVDPQDPVPTADSELEPDVTVKCVAETRVPCVRAECEAE